MLCSPLPGAPWGRNWTGWRREEGHLIYFFVSRLPPLGASFDFPEVATATACLLMQTCSRDSGGGLGAGEGGASFAWLIFINYLDNSKQARIKREM